MSTIFTDTQMDGKAPETQAGIAIRQTLERIRDNPTVGFCLGVGTQTFALLTEAAATLGGRPVEEVRTHYAPCNAQDPHAARPHRCDNCGTLETRPCQVCGKEAE